MITLCYNSNAASNCVLPWSHSYWQCSALCCLESVGFFALAIFKTGVAEIIFVLWTLVSCASKYWQFIVFASYDDCYRLVHVLRVNIEELSYTAYGHLSDVFFVSHIFIVHTDPSLIQIWRLGATEPGAFWSHIANVVSMPLLDRLLIQGKLNTKKT